MLLGLLSLHEVRDLLDEVLRNEPSATTPDAGRARRFDPAFGPAVEAGTLTEAQAFQRGKREALARKLATRHRISLDQAYAVADNRTSLLSIMRNRTPGKPIKATHGGPAANIRSLVVAASILITLVASLAILRQLAGPASAPDPQQVHSASVPPAPVPRHEPVDRELRDVPVESYARVQADDRGKILMVEATNPRNVLVAFCKSHEQFRRLEPVSVVPTVPPSDVAQLGLLRDLDEVDDYRIVVIRRDPETRRWFVGNPGKPDEPVSIFPAPESLVPGTESPI